MEKKMDFDKFSTQAKIECASHYISAAKNIDHWLFMEFRIEDAEQATQDQLLKVFDSLECSENWHENSDYDYYFEIGSVYSKSGNPVIVELYEDK
jgi:hypothetical protein